MTEREKIKAVHDYIILNCQYDYENYLNGTLPRISSTAYGALVKGYAICEGYSAAFNVLAEACGLRSISVMGTAPMDIENTYVLHMWNAVLIDGQVYLIDCTWDDPVPDQKGVASDFYFMRTAEEFRGFGYTFDDADVLAECLDI